MGTVNPRDASGIAGDSLVHHLNMTADTTKGNLSEYAGCEFIFGLSEETSKQMIYVLQDFFKGTKLGQAFNRKLYAVNKEVTITDDFAPDTQMLPQIVVKAIPVDHTPVSLGNFIGRQEDGAQLFDIYGGLANMVVTLDIYDAGKPNVCALADVVFLSLMQYVRDRLLRMELTTQPQIKFSAAAKVSGTGVGGELYKLSLSVPVIGQWRQYLEIETVDANTIRTEPTADGAL